MGDAFYLKFFLTGFSQQDHHGLVKYTCVYVQCQKINKNDQTNKTLRNQIVVLSVHKTVIYVLTQITDILISLLLTDIQCKNGMMTLVCLLITLILIKTCVSSRAGIPKPMTHMPHTRLVDSSLTI